jgi:RHS repeat-associated protein
MRAGLRQPRRGFAPVLLSLLVLVLACGGGHGTPGGESTTVIREAVTCAPTDMGTSSCTPSGGATGQAGIAVAWPSPAVVSAGNDMSLPGSGSVGADGQYHYTLPLDVPDGRMGMAPKLALNYSSGAGNGPLGVGWSLSGLSAIMPCPEIQAIDKQSLPVTMSGNDALCLDGVRLFDTSNGAGTSYQTEVENYSQITTFTDTSTWAPVFRVQSQDGLTRIYKQRGKNKTTGKGLYWLLDTEYDANGNAISYSYYDWTSPQLSNVNASVAVQEFAIQKITYTNRMTGGVADTSGMRQVVFSYKSRPDPISMRYGASNPDPRCNSSNYCNQPQAVDVHTSQLLSRIDVSAPVPTLAAGEQTVVVWTYVLGYTTSTGTGRSLLTTVDKHGWQGAGNALTRTFSYDSASGLDASRWYAPAKLSSMVANDYSTALLLNTGPSLGPTNDVVLYGDLFHNGQTLLLVDNGGLAPGHIVVQQITKSGALATVPITGLDSATLTNARIVDLNGDGVPEIVAPNMKVLVNPGAAYPGSPGGFAYSVFTLNVATQAYSESATTLWYRDPREPYDGTQFFGQPAVYSNGFFGPADYCQGATLDQDQWDGSCDWYNITQPPSEVLSPLFFADVAGAGTAQGIWIHHQPWPGGQGFPAQPVPNGSYPDLTCQGGFTGGLYGQMQCTAYDYATVSFQNGVLPTNVNLATAYSYPMLSGELSLGQMLTVSDGSSAVVPFPMYYRPSNSSPQNPVIEWAAQSQRNLPIWDITGHPPDSLAGYSVDSLAGYSVPSGSNSLVLSLPVSPNTTAIGDFDGRAVAEVFNFVPGNYAATVFDTNLFDWQTRVMDLDGDGRSEVVVYHMYNYGNPPGPASTTGWVDKAFMFHWGAAGASPQPVALSNTPVVVADFDGDGVNDMLAVAFTAGVPGQHTYAAHSFYRGRVTAHDRLTQVSNNVVANGMLSTSGYFLESATYTTQPSTWSSTGACGSYPVACSPDGMTVVQKHVVASGMGQSDEHDYAYGTARFDVLGRGFLGFDWIDDFEPTRPSETVAYYNNTSPVINGAYLGARPVKVMQYTPTAPIGAATQIPIRQTVRVDFYNSFVTTGRAYTIQDYQWLSVENEYTTTLNWSSAPHFGGPLSPNQLRVRVGTTSFDSYGNVTDSKIVTSGGVTTETKTDYYSPTAAPFLRSLVHDVYSYSYDPTTVANPTARYITYTYDAAGRERTEVTNNQATDETVQRTTTYSRTGDGVINRTDVDAFGTNANGYYKEPRRSTIVYLDTYEQMFTTMTKDSLGHLKHTLVNPTYGVAQDFFDENNVETRVVLDDFGRETSRSNAAGTTVSTSYARWLDSNGLVQGTMVTTRSGLASQPTIRGIDVRGHTVLTEVPHINYGFDVSGTAYDALGRMTQQYRPQTQGWAPPFVPNFVNGSTVTAYDPLDRVVSVTTPDGQVTSMSYTFLTSTTTDPSGHQTQITKDLDGRTTQTVRFNTTPGGYNAVLTFQYGQFGQVSSVSENSGPTQWSTYDLLGRRIKLIDPDSGTTNWTYNGFGDVLSENRAGVTTSYVYDSLGRVTTTTYGDGVTQYTYDTAPMGIGKLAQTLSEDFVLTTYGYDALGRHDYTEWTVPSGNETSLFFNSWKVYDNQGRESTVTYPWSADLSGLRITTQDNYDTWSGALQTITWGGTTLWQVGDRAPDGSLSYGYNGNGEFLYRAYDANGRVTYIEDRAPAGFDIVNLSYAYNPDGTTQSVWDGVTGDGRSEGYSYDSLHQLTNWQVYVGLYDDPWGRITSYGYDPFGNMTTVQVNGAYTEYNIYGGQSYIPQQTQGYRPHQLAEQYYYAQGTGPVYAYDLAGRQTYASATRRQVTYKDYDLPRNVVDTQNNTTTFAYDAGRNRVRKSGGATGTMTITVGGLFEERFNSGGYPTEFVLYVPATDGITMQLSNYPWWPTAVSCLHSDKLGNVVAITSSASSGPQYFYYDPFGRRADVTGQATSVGIPDVQLGFTSQEMDDDLGLINMRGRIYDPVQRRFLSMDPHITNPLNELNYNPYIYVLNSPTNGTDPTGLDDFFDIDPVAFDPPPVDDPFSTPTFGSETEPSLPAVVPPSANPDMGMTGATLALPEDAVNPPVWTLEAEDDPYLGIETIQPQPRLDVTPADQVEQFKKAYAFTTNWWSNIRPETIHLVDGYGYMGTPYPKGVVEVGEPTAQPPPAPSPVEIMCENRCQTEYVPPSCLGSDCPMAPAPVAEFTGAVTAGVNFSGSFGGGQAGGEAGLAVSANGVSKYGSLGGGGSLPASLIPSAGGGWIVTAYSSPDVIPGQSRYYSGQLGFVQWQYVWNDSGWGVGLGAAVPPGASGAAGSSYTWTRPLFGDGAIGGGK